MKKHTNKSLRKQEGTKRTHYYLESFSPAKDQIAERYTDVVINNFTMSFRCIVVTKYLHGSDDIDSRGVGRNYYDALLIIWVRVSRVALAHNQVQLRPWIASTTDPPAIKGIKKQSSEENQLLTICGH